jgi:hypothetical protein
LLRLSAAQKLRWPTADAPERRPSTSASGGCGGDQNGDGSSNTVLDCEIDALASLNATAITTGRSSSSSPTAQVVHDQSPANAVAVDSGCGACPQHDLSCGK